MGRLSAFRERVRGQRLLAAAVPIVLASTLLLLLPEVTTWLRWVAMAALGWWLPGALLVAHWRLRDLEPPTAGLLALGLGLCWLVVLLLLIHAVPGPMGRGHLAGVYGAGAVALAAGLLWRRPLPLRPVLPWTWTWLLALVALAGLLRLPGLGYHQLHTDETVVLLHARQALEGEDGAFAGHQKGPGELAVATAFYGAMGSIDEATGRLPFALASVGSVLGVALLGRRLFSAAAGFWAGVLLAFNGFALGLSRLVQYQGAVLLMAVLIVLAAWEFSRRGEVRWLVLAGAFCALGLVMHYELALLAPLVLVLAWLGWRRAADRRRVLAVGLGAAGVAGLLVALAYLPLLTSPRLAATQDYLGVRVGGASGLNLAFFVEMGTFYNSTYFYGGLLLLLAAGFVLGWRRARSETLALVLWFVPFFLLYSLVMEFPGTHYYHLMESWSLLAAVPLATLARASGLRPTLRWVGIGLAIAWLALSGGYLYVMFFRQAPETLADYPRNRPALYRAPYGDAVPLYPRFGFAVQEGWKPLGLLSYWGYLPGRYASNERSRSLAAWYLSSFRREQFARSPAWVLVAGAIEKPNPEYSEEVLEGYQHVGEVRVRGEPRAAIWAREPLPVPYVVYDAEDFELFDDIVPALEPEADPEVILAEEELGGGLVLQSGGMDKTVVGAGQVLHLLLVWRPEEPLPLDYKLFVHVAGEDGRPLAQWDGMPCLNTARTSRWAAGEAVRDHVLLRLPAELPAGSYRVLVGLYDPASGERLGGRALELGSLAVY